MVNSYFHSWRSNLCDSATLCRVNIKASLYIKALQMYFIPITTTFTINIEQAWANSVDADQMPSDQGLCSFLLILYV